MYDDLTVKKTKHVKKLRIDHFLNNGTAKDLVI